MYDDIRAQHSQIFQKIAEHFQCEPQNIVINKQFSEGRSGDLVLLVCIQDPAVYSDCGSYVLKIFSSAEGSLEEISRTHTANEHSGRGHISVPELRLFSSDPPFYLYDKAGDEFMQATSMSELEPYTVAQCVKYLSGSLLTEWNEIPQVCHGSIFSIIHDWVGEQRFAVSSRLTQRIEAQITDELTASFHFNGRNYPNPLHYLIGGASPLSVGKADLQCVLYGQIHGDLNMNNIITQKLPGNAGYQFSLIDFEQYRSYAPLLFDQAYLLLCVLLQDAAGHTLLEWSEANESFFPHLRKLDNLPDRNKPPFSYMQAHIDEMKRFINHQQQHNRSAAVWQLLAAHVAAGLNFVNKRGCNDRQQKMALLYAASAMRALLDSLSIEVEEQVDAPSLQSEAGEHSELWKQVDRFSPDNRYILLTACTGGPAVMETMEHLSPVKWLMIIEINHLAENPIRDQILSTYKHFQGYRLYEISTEEKHEFESAPTWLHLNIPDSQKNLSIYYDRHLQKELRQCLNAVLSIRENEPLYIIADFDTDMYSTIGDALLKDIFLQAGDNTPLRVVSLNGVSLAFESDGILQCMESENSLAHLGQSVHLFLDTRHDPAEIRIPCKDGMKSISPEFAANLANDMVLVHRNITYGSKDDNGDGFYRGNEATWIDIANGRDIPRLDYELELKDRINTKLDQVSTGAGGVLKLFHRPGGGGTTLAKRIAWDFCIKYPTAMLHSLSNQTAERLKELYSETIKPLLVIVEVSDGQISNDQISMLRRELIQKSIRILFLFISRTTSRERNSVDNTFYLPNTDDLCMTSDESQSMYDRFSNRLRMLLKDEAYTDDISQRIEDLGALTYEAENVDLRQPFFYGLYTYGNGFQGITKYVEHNSQGFSPDERITLNVLSLITVFSQSINLSFEEAALFLSPKQAVTPAVIEQVKEWVYAHELVVRRGWGIRICHPSIAEEILRQSDLLKADSNGTDALLELAYLFVDRLVDFYGEESRRLNDVFHDIFIHRMMVYEEEPKKFSELLTRLYTRGRCTDLMRHLAEKVPWNPHYRNHLARLYLYPVTPEQKIFPETKTALKYANEAIQCAKEQDGESLSIHYHVLGKAYAKQCVGILRESLINGSLTKALKAAKNSYWCACDAFRKCISEDKSGYGLTGKLELYSNVLNVIKSKNGKNAPLSTILTRKDNSDPEAVKFIASLISEGGDLISQYIDQFDVSNAAFRSACFRFYSVIGKLAKLEVVFNANALTRKEVCTRNRAIATVLMYSGFLEDRSFSFDHMPKENLQRICALMKENISADNDNEQDRVRWFEAFRRLPASRLQEAYQFLLEWPNAEQNLFVCYYRYVIAFLMHVTTGDTNYDKVKRHLNQTIALSRNAYGKNVSVSLNYYGLGDSSTDLLGPRPVLNIDDMKEDRVEQNKNFRKDKCKIIPGKIDNISEGLITIRFHCGNDRNVFFAKSPNIYQISLADEGRPVEFSLGFSYSGLRAWDVELSSQMEDPMDFV